MRPWDKTIVKPWELETRKVYYKVILKLRDHETSKLWDNQTMRYFCTKNRWVTKLINEWWRYLQNSPGYTKIIRSWDKQHLIQWEYETSKLWDHDIMQQANCVSMKQKTSKLWDHEAMRPWVLEAITQANCETMRQAFVRLWDRHASKLWDKETIVKANCYMLRPWDHETRNPLTLRPKLFFCLNPFPWWKQLASFKLLN